MSVSEAVEKFVELHQLEKSEKYAVAVSGGRDSMTLFWALQDAGFENLIALHFNHQLRGEQSDKDEQFLCESLLHVTDLYTGTANVAEMDGGLETSAREARYHFFQESLELLDFKGLFMAHHADDQAETVLYNLCRGGAGLRGMKGKSQRGDMPIFRPLLEVKRQEIDAYVVQNEIEYREDPSNAEPVTARNRMRHEVLPLLNSVLQRDASASIHRALKGSEVDEDYIQSLFCYDDFLDPQGRLFLPKLQDSHAAICLRVIKQYLEQQDVSNISYALLEEAMKLLSSHAVAKINLPEGKSLRRKEKRLFVEMAKSEG